MDTIGRALAACDAELVVEPRLGGSVDRERIRKLLGLTPSLRMPRPSGARPERILRILVFRHVRFVLIGETAARLHGAPIPAKFIDVVPELAYMNRRRLRAALGSMSPRSERPVPPLRSRGRQTFLTDVGPIRCWWTGRALPPYAQLSRGADLLAAADSLIVTATLDDLIRMARLDRPQLVPMLAAVREEVDARELRERS